MKPDTERRKYYHARLHEKRRALHVHLSKDLRGKLKKKTRAILARRGDRVKILRGPGKGKEGKIVRIDVSKRKIFVEGVSIKNARGKETLLPLQPSNLMLVSIEETKERKELFSESAFKKPEKKQEKEEVKEKETEKTIATTEKKMEKEKEETGKKEKEKQNVSR